MNNTKEKKTWKTTVAGNEILNMDGFYISFNNNNSTAVASIPSFRGDSSLGETALCKDSKYFILNGDHREKYEKLSSKGFVACKKYFDANQDKKSSWSN